MVNPGQQFRLASTVVLILGGGCLHTPVSPPCRHRPSKATPSANNTSQQRPRATSADRTQHPHQVAQRGAWRGRVGKNNKSEMQSTNDIRICLIEPHRAANIDVNTMIIQRHRHLPTMNAKIIMATMITMTSLKQCSCFCLLNPTVMPPTIQRWLSF